MVSPHRRELLDANPDKPFFDAMERLRRGHLAEIPTPWSDTHAQTLRGAAAFRSPHYLDNNVRPSQIAQAAVWEVLGPAWSPSLARFELATRDAPALGRRVAAATKELFVTYGDQRRGRVRHLEDALAQAARWTLAILRHVERQEAEERARVHAPEIQMRDASERPKEPKWKALALHQREREARIVRLATQHGVAAPSSRQVTQTFAESSRSEANSRHAYPSPAPSSPDRYVQSSPAPQMKSHRSHKRRHRRMPPDPPVEQEWATSSKRQRDSYGETKQFSDSSSQLYSMHDYSLPASSSSQDPFPYPAFSADASMQPPDYHWDPGAGSTAADAFAGPSLAAIQQPGSQAAASMFWQPPVPVHPATALPADADLFDIFTTLNEGEAEDTELFGPDPGQALTAHLGGLAFPGTF